MSTSPAVGSFEKATTLFRARGKDLSNFRPRSVSHFANSISCSVIATKEKKTKVDPSLEARVLTYKDYNFCVVFRLWSFYCFRPYA